MYNYRDYAETAVRRQSVIKGLDLMTEGSVMDESRSPLLVNVWKDYGADGGVSLSSRPGSRIKFTIDTSAVTVDGKNIMSGLVQMSEFGGGYVVRMGQVLFWWKYTASEAFTISNGNVVPSSGAVVISQELTAEKADRNNVRMSAVIYDNTFYFFDKGTKKIIYFYIGEDGVPVVGTFSGSLPASGAYPDENTAPLVGINGNSNGGFNSNIPYNMMSRYYTVEYLAEAETLKYLNAGSGVSAAVYLLSASGVWTKQTADVTVGAAGIVFAEGKAPAAGTEFRVLFDRGSCENDTVFDMRRFVVFDERVFAAVCDGRKQNRLYWSRAGNPLYWADTDYVTDSHGGAGVKDLLACGKYIVALKQDVRGESGIFLHSPQDNESDLTPRIYPSIYGLHDVGAFNELSAVNVDGEPVFLSASGLKAIVSTDLTSTASIQHRSSMVDRLLCADINNTVGSSIGAPRVFGYQGYICVFANSRIWLADTRQRFSNAGTKSTEYEWFKWDNVVPWKNISGGAWASKMRVYDVFEDVDDTLALTVRSGDVFYVFAFDSSDGTDEMINPYNGVNRFPVLAVVTTRFENYGYPNCKKKPIRRQGYAKIEGENIEVHAKADAEYTEPRFAVPFGVPHSDADLGQRAVSEDLKDAELLYDIYIPRFTAMSVAYSSTKPMKFYYAVNGAIIKEAMKYQWH